ncbi:pro-sigmaK processing inhibitor BofA family protein [Caldalkalibacillus mannanilyticus]|uniref:pro-sigmaK processing inhibitor BofA family protein n=1 Tax=Caldalkalibacillus mannanilyticus TaxID=1418 RepID=UPI00046A5108|nr:pro-sigmaK processing inhibitor BofA family protein [Caldalkalibacillus mannanilyticus]
MDQTTIIAIFVVAMATAIGVLYQVRGAFIQWIGKGMFHFILGAFMLFIFNMLGSAFEMHIPLNIITIGIAGLLGIPGVISLVIIKLMVI